MAQVAIPAEHFTRNVKNNYSDIDTAIVREFVQNSSDAGAKNIWFNMDDVSLEVIDDGCGMTSDVLVKALLTLSGTYKKTGAVGGFGAAKEILLYQHEKYEIHTLTTKVSGSVLEYTMTEDQDLYQGTKIKIWFHEHYEFDMFGFLNKMRNLIRSCQIEANIFINGDKIECDVKRGDEVRDLDWCKIYITKCDPQQYATIRIKGVTMFNVYVGDTAFQVVIEITKPSTEILTVNRDGLVYNYSSKLQSIIQEISVEKSSFGKVFQKRIVYEGSNKFFDDVEVIINRIDVLLEGIPDEDREVIRPHVVAAARTANISGGTFDAFTDALCHMPIDEKIINHIDSNLRGINTDFHILVNSKGYNKVPDHLDPSKMGKQYQKLAKMWKHCLKLVMRANKIKLSYNIGWVIDSESTIALYKKVDKQHIFMLNPMLPWWRTSNHYEIFVKMVMYASHEIAHADRIYHDESFTKISEDYVVGTLTSIKSWWEEYQAAKDEVL